MSEKKPIRERLREWCAAGTAITTRHVLLLLGLWLAWKGANFVAAMPQVVAQLNDLVARVEKLETVTTTTSTSTSTTSTTVPLGQ